jgi:2-polyprenyl-6-methoxyphenol hydroxylase-like FAD-dependent oxidoreductase
VNHAPVLIAGGGPVGMTLALELASHGVRSILVERNAATTRHPKMDLTNGRSMELYRRLRLSDRLRRAGVPEDHVFDIVWATSGPGTGRELCRFRYPSPRDKREIARLDNDGSYTCEPPMRVSQIVIEPVLKAVIDEHPLVDARFGWAFESFEESADGVAVVIRNTETGAEERLHGDYLAGCDGGGSRVRAQLGIDLEGAFNVGGAFTIHFRSDRRDLLQPDGPWWHWQTPRGSLVAQDDRDTWTLHTFLPEGVDAGSLDPVAILREWAGRDFEFEILVANPWSPHLVIASRFSAGRVYLAGDSIHQVIPTGGYGMNTGVGDAVDLGWKLAATINGWAGPRLLESYEAERRPIVEQNRAASERHMRVRIQIAELFAARLGQPEPDYDAIGAEIARLGNAENEYWGIEHGYRYESSPVICHDGTKPPPFDPLVVTPTTWPGARLPHVYLTDGSALYDHLGPDFTLLALAGTDCGGLAEAAEQAGIPLKIVSLPFEPCLDLLERKLLLVRPDHHVAWRGNEAPRNFQAMLGRVTGHESARGIDAGAR